MEYPNDIRAYVADLYARRLDGFILPRRVIGSCEWEPKPKQCHDNVNRCIRSDPRYTPVRGWLFFDFGGLLDRVAFLQHSVLRFPDGSIADITPKAVAATQDYPFIQVAEPDDEFFSKEQYTVEGNLYFLLEWLGK